MKPITELFEEVKESEDSEQINDFIVIISKTPELKQLFFINFFLKNLEPKILEKIKINIAYFLGELGKKVKLDNKIINILIKLYYDSDRWVRNEIVQAFGKIYRMENPSDEVGELLAKALMEEYPPIRINSLQVISRLVDIPNLALKNILLTIDTQNSEIKNLNLKVLFNHLHTESDLYELLDKLGIASTLKSRTIRTLIMIYFDMVIPLQSFRRLIEYSRWDSETKEIFYKEIDDFSKMLFNL